MVTKKGSRTTEWQNSRTTELKNYRTTELQNYRTTELFVTHKIIYGWTSRAINCEMADRMAELQN
jgi:hypothetical protein